MQIAKIRFEGGSRPFKGISSGASEYVPTDLSKWRGWRVELIGPAVFLISPGEGAAVYEIPRASCHIEYVLAAGEAFSIEAVKAAKPATAVERKRR
jgi:hypothetical protein